MLAEAAKFAPLRFSTREIPERERMLRWREEFGQSMLHVDIQPLSEVPFQAEAILWPLTGLRTLLLKGSPMHLQRAQTNLADNDESIGMIISFNIGEISQRGRNIVLGPGDAVALLHAPRSCALDSQIPNGVIALGRASESARISASSSIWARLASQTGSTFFSTQSTRCPTTCRRTSSSQETGARVGRSQKRSTPGA